MPNVRIPNQRVPFTDASGIITTEWFAFLSQFLSEVLMPSTTTVLIEGKAAENAQTTQYTARVKIMVDKFTAHNYSAGAVTLAVNFVPSGGAAATSNRVVLYTLAAGETYLFPEVVGQYLNTGDFVSTIAGAAASVSIRASGREIT